jgi:hypothetical protein
VSASVDAPGVVVSTYVPPEVAAAIRARARAADRSVSAELRRAIRDLYANDEGPADGPSLRKAAHGSALRARY